jgi:hypothetical protein
MGRRASDFSLRSTMAAAFARNWLRHICAVLLFFGSGLIGIFGCVRHVCASIPTDGLFAHTERPRNCRIRSRRLQFTSTQYRRRARCLSRAPILVVRRPHRQSPPRRAKQPKFQRKAKVCVSAKTSLTVRCGIPTASAKSPTIAMQPIAGQHQRRPLASATAGEIASQRQRRPATCGRPQRRSASRRTGLEASKLPSPLPGWRIRRG